MEETFYVILNCWCVHCNSNVRVQIKTDGPNDYPNLPEVAHISELMHRVRLVKYN